MKVKVDFDLCEGNAVCQKVAPDIFDVGDDDRATLLRDPSDDDRDAVEAAVRRCPRQALEIVDD